jgi:hypothetical protein
MKLVACNKCNDIMMLVGGGMVRTCYCGAVGGKYLDDNITAVVNLDALVVGIDNNGFNLAKRMIELNKDIPYRVDYFFTGWIPTKPGEVIVVEDVESILEYDYHIEDEDKNYGSTLPTEIAEENENRNPLMTFADKVKKIFGH